MEAISHHIATKKRKAFRYFSRKLSTKPFHEIIFCSTSLAQQRYFPFIISDSIKFPTTAWNGEVNHCRSDVRQPVQSSSKATFWKAGWINNIIPIISWIASGKLRHEHALLAHSKFWPQPIIMQLWGSEVVVTCAMTRAHISNGRSKMPYTIPHFSDTMACRWKLETEIFTGYD